MVETRWPRQKRLERWTGRSSADLDAEELTRAKIGGYEPGPDGYMVGRDPRHMTVAELEAMGHARMSASATIRSKCLDCAGSPHEVRLCAAITCPSWPRRMGTDPFRAPPSEAQREHARRLGARMKSGASNPSRLNASDEEEAAGVAE